MRGAVRRDRADAQANTDMTRAIGLDFAEPEYINGGAIGLLVAPLVRTNRQPQELLAYGLDKPCRPSPVAA